MGVLREGIPLHMYNSESRLLLHLYIRFFLWVSRVTVTSKLICDLYLNSIIDWIQTVVLWWIVESAGEEDTVIGQQHKVSWCEMSQSDKVIVVDTSSVFMNER